MWGPTCDSFDRIIPPDEYRVPDGIQTDDLFMLPCMGASTIVLFRRSPDDRYEFTAYDPRGNVLGSS